MSYLYFRKCYIQYPDFEIKMLATQKKRNILWFLLSKSIEFFCKSHTYKEAVIRLMLKLSQIVYHHCQWRLIMYVENKDSLK